MKRALGHVFGCGLLVVALGLAQDGFAQDGFADVPQDNDAVLQSYDLAVERLNGALGALSEDGSLSLDALDQAAQTLRALSRDTSSPNLVTALERTFTRAETAVQNRSATDLGVQVAVLRGGFWRLVYESALRAANEGDVSLSRERLARIAADMTFSDPNLDALNGADTYPALITAFDTGAAVTVQTHLNEASAVPGDKDATYSALAEAYAHFLPVQDSPRVSAATTVAFSQAFQALVTDDSETLQGRLATLGQSLSDFQGAAEAAAQGVLQQDVGTAPSPNPAAAVPAAPAAGFGPNAASPLSAPAENGALETGELETSELETGGQEGQTPTAAAPGTPTPVPALPLLNTNQADLAAELSTFGLAGDSRADLLNDYAARDLESVTDAVEALYADSSRTLSAIESGNASSVQARLEAYRDTFERFLAPLLGANAPLSADTRRLVNHFATAPGLRLQDGAVLVGQTDRVAAALSGTAAPGPGLVLSTSLVWSGWLRLLVMMVLGLLAVVPLYLLNLAFGGANRNWRLVGAALFLLLLPIMYEGLTSLLELLAALSGVAVLGGLSAFSIFQNTVSQVVWALLSALAIGLAVAGLYGICVQFGLLGKRSAGDTVISPGDAPLGRASTGTAVDWDEEF